MSCSCECFDRWESEEKLDEFNSFTFLNFKYWFKFCFSSNVRHWPVLILEKSFLFIYLFISINHYIIVIKSELRLYIGLLCVLRPLTVSFLTPPIFHEQFLGHVSKIGVATI